MERAHEDFVGQYAPLVDLIKYEEKYLTPKDFYEKEKKMKILRKEFKRSINVYTDDEKENAVIELVERNGVVTAYINHGELKELIHALSECELIIKKEKEDDEDD
jgi:transposase-like protein